MGGRLAGTVEYAAVPPSSSESLFLSGPAGRLEALFQRPAGAEPRGAAVVCHPHPLFGGTMHNTVVFRTARALLAAGLAVLRFNFRGVEGSEGEHDGEGGEERDAACALDWLEERFGAQELWGAGFSFGSRTVCRLALEDERLERLVGVALPVARFDCRFMRQLEPPTLLVFGEKDDFGTAGGFRALFTEVPKNFRVAEIPGADHFFRYRTPDLERTVREYAQEALDDSP